MDSSNDSTRANPIYTSDEEDAIIRAAARHPSEIEHTVINFSTTELSSFALSFFTHFGQPPASDPGPLEALPLEILRQILLSLDLETALVLTWVNRRARRLVAETWEYRQVREHALQCLCAVFRTGYARNTMVSIIYSALVTKQCSLCGSFGGVFFIPTGRLCCLSCLMDGTKTILNVRSLASLCHATGRSMESIRKDVPTLRTSPGLYHPTRYNYHSKELQLWVASEHCSKVLGTGPAEPGSELRGYMVSSSIPYLDLTTGEAQLGLLCKGSVTVLDLSGARVGTCTAPWYTLFSREGFLEHFQQCGAAKAHWESSQERTDRIVLGFSSGMDAGGSGLP